jgi:hypothetical protein
MGDVSGVGAGPMEKVVSFRIRKALIGSLPLLVDPTFGASSLADIRSLTGPQVIVSFD